MPIKGFLVGFTLIMIHICHYYTRYSKQMTATLNASGLTAAQKDNVKAFWASMQQVCDILRGLTGY
jgi:hypothetical protein